MCGLQTHLRVLSTVVSKLFAEVLPWSHRETTAGSETIGRNAAPRTSVQPRGNCRFKVASAFCHRPPDMPFHDVIFVEQCFPRCSSLRGKSHCGTGNEGGEIQMTPGFEKL